MPNTQTDIYKKFLYKALGGILLSINKAHTQNKRAVGAKYEKMAAIYLEEKGYIIIERNYRNKCGEIDIIAYAPESEGADLLVIIEVKYRSGNQCGEPLEAVDNRKQKRISRATLYYLMKKGRSTDRPCRFDVVAINGDNSIEHIKNAFEFRV
jgi:putative endonuclease